MAVTPFGNMAVTPFGNMAVTPFGNMAVTPFHIYKTYPETKVHYSCTHYFTSMILTHCGRVTQICVFNTVKLGTSASSP